MTVLSTELFTQVNYWAVVVAGLVAFGIGGLWYSPALFEQAWLNANGYSPEQVREIQSGLGAPGFISAFLAYLLLALAFALLLAAIGGGGIVTGIVLALLLWLGFAATIGLTGTLFSPRPLTAWLIDTGFQGVFLLATGLILGLWR